MKGTKDTKGKIRWDCVPFKMIEGIAKVMTYGAEKYNENPNDPNWIKVEDGENKYKAAFFRHFMKDLDGDFLDEESGHPHMFHFMFNAMAYAYFRIKNSAYNKIHDIVKLK